VPEKENKISEFMIVLGVEFLVKKALKFEEN